MSQNHFHLPDRTGWVPFSLARRRISLVPGNRTTVNVELCDIAEILLKVALNTINLNLQSMR
jgi:hypothetical protein